MNKRDMRAWLKEEKESALAEPCADAPMGEGRYHTSYLGSVISLAPSGKYYTPWANGNVNACPRCKGKGTTTNKHADPVALARSEQEAYELRQLLLDVYGAWSNGEWPKEEEARLRHLEKEEENAKPTRSCSWCGGMGSREAWLDSLFWEQLDEVAESLGCWIENGEGDPTDVFLGCTCPKCDEEDAEEEEDACDE